MQEDAAFFIQNWWFYHKQTLDTRLAEEWRDDEFNYEYYEEMDKKLTEMRDKQT